MTKRINDIQSEPAVKQASPVKHTSALAISTEGRNLLYCFEIPPNVGMTKRINDIQSEPAVKQTSPVKHTSALVISTEGRNLLYCFKILHSIR